MTNSQIIEFCNRLRRNIGAIDQEVVDIRPKIFQGEAVANLMLAHRHLEDARMRLGKVIQALEGGVSILDHPEVKALIEKIRKGE